MDRHAPTFEQEVLADFIAHGHFERHVRRARTRNASRRVAMIEAFDENLRDGAKVVGENAGGHMVVWLRDVAAARLDDLVARAADRRVGI